MCAMRFQQTMTISNNTIASNDSIYDKLELNGSFLFDLGESCSGESIRSRKVGCSSHIVVVNTLKISTVFDRFLDETNLTRYYETSVADFSADGANVARKIEDMVDAFKSSYPQNQKVVEKNDKLCRSVEYRTYKNECYFSPPPRFHRQQEYLLKNPSEIPVFAERAT